MKKFFVSVLLIVLVVALGAAYFQWRAQQHGTVTSPTVADEPLVPSAPSEPAGPRYPIPAPSASPDAEEPPVPLSQEQSAQEPVVQVPLEAAAPSTPLPSLNDSNAQMTEIFTGLFGAERMHALFTPDELVRRFVVTVDNLPNKKLPRQQLLVNRVSGPFAVTGEGGQFTIAPDNAARYAPYVLLAGNIDAQQLVDVYVRFYPLFQAAYAELGVPNAYFNDRLVDVIDQLLESPRVEEPIRLVQPKVFYVYADPKLEALSAGQKILLRMGSANAEQIKAKLREIRQALISVSPPRGDEDGEEPAPDPVMQSPEGDWKIVP
jgi:hypothetical protein